MALLLPHGVGINRRGRELRMAQPALHEIEWTLLLDSRVLRDQELNERRKQRFASLADVVHELEESQVDREFLLGNPPMRAQPTPQERPKAFHRVHMHFAQGPAGGNV